MSLKSDPQKLHTLFASNGRTFRNKHQPKKEKPVKRHSFYLERLENFLATFTSEMSNPKRYLWKIFETT